MGSDGGPKSVFARCDENIVWLAGKQGPAPAEWDAYTAAVVALAKEGPSKLVQILVVTDGGGPTSVQRTDFVTAIGDTTVRTAVLSGSTLVRGIVTVFNWFKVENKVFAPKDVMSALTFVNIGSVRRGSVWATVEGLARQVGGVETVKAARPFIRTGSRDDLLAR